MSWGIDNRSTAESATSFGRECLAQEKGATAWGNQCQAMGRYATSFGRGSRAMGDYSLAIGDYSYAQAHASVALGRSTIMKTLGGLSIGHYNDAVLADPETSDVIAPDSPVFIVGNGIGDGPFRSNAFMVRRDAKVKIGNGQPIADLHIKTSENFTNGRGTGGIVLESELSDAYWQIHFGVSALSFSANGRRRAYLQTNGQWIDDENFTSVINLAKLKSSSSQYSIADVLIGLHQDRKSRKSVIRLDAQAFLQNYPDLVVYDDKGTPRGIDYRQLYLLTISDLQREITTNRDHQAQLDTLRHRMEEQERMIQDLMSRME